MCQLLGMNCATPTDVTFSFTGFAARGGGTDHHADGFGIAFFDDKACRMMIGELAAGWLSIIIRHALSSKKAMPNPSA